LTIRRRLGLSSPASSNFHCTCDRAQISDVLRLVTIMLEAVREIRESEFRARSKQLGTKLCSVHCLGPLGIINLHVAISFAVIITGIDGHQVFTCRRLELTTVNSFNIVFHIWLLIT